MWEEDFYMSFPKLHVPIVLILAMGNLNLIFKSYDNPDFDPCISRLKCVLIVPVICYFLIFGAE